MCRIVREVARRGSQRRASTIASLFSLGNDTKLNYAQHVDDLSPAQNYSPLEEVDETEGVRSLGGDFARFPGYGRAAQHPQPTQHALKQPAHPLHAVH